MTSCFINPDTQLTDYMVFPRFLFDISINETARIVYMILLDRARLSCRNPAWCDSENRVFILFPVKQIAKRLGKGISVIKDALAVLESHGLIQRKHQGVGKANRIYVLLPKTDNTSLHPEYRPPITRLPCCRKTDRQSVGKAAATWSEYRQVIKIIIVKIIKLK